MPVGVGALLVLVDLGTDLVHLDVDTLRVGVDASEAGDGLAGAILVALAESEPRALGQHEDASAEDQGPGEAEAVWDAPGGARIDVLGVEVDHLGCPDAEGEEQLVARLGQRGA